MSRGGRALAARRGFALVIVIWGLGLIGLLTLAFIAAARGRAQIAGNLAAAAQAELLAESAVNVAILDLAAADGAALRPTRFSHDGQPVFCRLPQDSAAAVLVEDEAGKIDLNAASQPFLAQFLHGFGVESGEAETISRNIVAFRSAAANDAGADERLYAAAGRGHGPKKALFQSALELDQVLAISPQLAQRLSPFVTVFSQQATIDPRFAPPALLAALNGAPEAQVGALSGQPYPNGLARDVSQGGFATGGAGAFLIHAEVATARGGRFVREAIVVLQPGVAGPATAIREWRRGRERYAKALAELIARGASAPQC